MDFNTTVEDQMTFLRCDKQLTSPYDFEQQVCKDGRLYDIFLDVSKNLPEAEDYIRKYKDRYGWNDGFISQCSKFEPQELPRPFLYDEPFWQCFDNARSRALYEDYYYIEGIVITPTGAYLHAWNSKDGIDVFDFTYPAQECNRYFGVALKVEEKGAYGLVAYLEKETRSGEIGWATEAVRKFDLSRCS